MPLDFRMPEAHLFSSALYFPHYSVAIALLLILFWCAVRGFTEPLTKTKWILLTLLGGLANLGVALVYPFLIFLTAGVLGVYYLALIWQAKRILWRQGILVVIVFMFPLPLLLYYQHVMATNEIIRLWNEQVTTWSPNVLHYFLAYGVYLALAVAGVWRRRFGSSSRLPNDCSFGFG